MRAKFLISSLAALAVVIVFTFYGPVLVDQALAEVGGKAVSGYGWSSNIGWVQMKTGQQNPVTVDVVGTTGTFKGYGWSSNVGWLLFNPGGSYPAAPSHGVQIDLATNKLSGWARFLANGGGWDGWVNFNGVTYDPVAKKFNGYAWGADVVGWLDMSAVFADLTSIVEPPTCAEEYGGDCTCTNPDWKADNPASCPNNPDPTYTVTVKITGEGSGRVDWTNESCASSSCSISVDSGDGLVLDAVVDSGVFGGWTGCTTTTGNRCSLVNITSDKTVTVVFDAEVTGLPEPFTVDLATCSARLPGGICRIVMDCTTSGLDTCTDAPHYSRTAIRIENKMAQQNPPASLQLSLSSSYNPNYLSFVLCPEANSTEGCSASVSASTGDLYLHLILDPRQQGRTDNFTLTLSSDSGQGKSAQIKAQYQDTLSGSGAKSN